MTSKHLVLSSKSDPDKVYICPLRSARHPQRAERDRRLSGAAGGVPIRGGGVGDERRAAAHYGRAGDDERHSEVVDGNDRRHTEDDDDGEEELEPDERTQLGLETTVFLQLLADLNA